MSNPFQRINRSIQVSGLAEYHDLATNNYYSDLINVYNSSGVWLSIKAGVISGIRTNLTTGIQYKLSATATAANQIILFTEAEILGTPTPTSIRDALAGLPAGQKLPGSAIEGGVASNETGVSIRDKLETLTGAERLDAAFIDNIPTNTPNTYVVSYFPPHRFTVTDGMITYTVPAASRKGTILYIVVDGEQIDNDGVQYTYDTATGVVTFVQAWDVPVPPTTYTAAIHWLPATGDPGTATVKESDGVPTLVGVHTWEFAGATVAEVTPGIVRVTVTPGTALTVRDVDGTPSVLNVDTLEFATADFTVTDLGNGDVRVSRVSPELSATFALKSAPLLNQPASITTEFDLFSQAVSPGVLAAGKAIELQHTGGFFGGTATNTNSVTLRLYMNNVLVYATDARSITGNSGEREFNETIVIRALTNTDFFFIVDHMLGDGQSHEVRFGGNQVGGGNDSISGTINGATDTITFRLTAQFVSLNDGYAKHYGRSVRRLN